LQPAHELAAQALQVEPPTERLSPPRLDDRAANRDMTRCMRLPLHTGQRTPEPLLPIRHSSSKVLPQARHLNS
jgi:hypothetical protein